MNNAASVRTANKERNLMSLLLEWKRNVEPTRTQSSYLKLFCVKVSEIGVKGNFAGWACIGLGVSGSTP
jgi:hypothetical protein